MRLDVFASNYVQARARFQRAALATGCELSTYPIDGAAPTGESLTVDVAHKGSRSPRTALVVSSGTHGVEGFFGSAVQCALLEGLLRSATLRDHTAVVLIHAVNPYGFAWRRRVNEDNVDLNRNFLLPGQPFAGTPAAYGELDSLLNPRRAPTRLDPFLLMAGIEVLRRGFPALKNAVAQGQYDFPEGIFYGGSGPSRTQRILAEHAPAWLGTPERVVHLDLHTGLGPWGSYALCPDLPSTSPRVAQLRLEFGAKNVQGYEPSGVLYEIRGGLGPFLEHRFPATQYDCMLAEFGTYPALRVLQAMRVENWVHLHAEHDSPAAAALSDRAKRRLVEVFCPGSHAWRATVLDKGLRVARQALRATG